MTLPSRRKLPTTRPNTPTSASRPCGALVALTLLVSGAAPLVGADRNRGGLPSDSALAVNIRGGHAPWTEPSESSPLTDGIEPTTTRKTPTAKPPVIRESAVRSATAKATPGAATARKPRKKPNRAIRPAAYEPEFTGPATSSQGASSSGNHPRVQGDPTDALPEWPHGDDSSRVEELASSQAPAIESVDHLAQDPKFNAALEAAEDADTRRARVRDQLTRPFKQMREIRPYYDYEPDSEQLAADRCFNLCPRPGSPDCPDCEKLGPDGVAQDRMACPECPIEIDLRDTARLVGSINDFPTRNFPHIHYCWEPTNLFSYPLYFEDHCLERYGHTRHFLLQPPFSVGLFCAQFVGLPYQMTIDPIAKKRYALGWYRPGQYVPYKYYQVPWNTEAALVEAGVIAGSYFLFAPGVGP